MWIRMASASVVVLALAVAAAAGTGVSGNTLQNLQGALVFLQKARMTAAVQAKLQNLKKAREQLILARYDRGGYRTAAIALVMQAQGKVREFKIDRANALIDLAIIKVRHAIQAYRREAPARRDTRTGK